MGQPSAPPVFIGIDPGATGGIAVLCGSSAAAYTMPKTPGAIWSLLSGFITPSPGNVIAMIEQVGGYIKGKERPGAYMFEFGENYGWLVMACTGLGLTLHKGASDFGRLHPIVPQSWQNNLKIDSKRKKTKLHAEETDKEFKARLHWKAQEQFPKSRFPNLRVTLRTCDALLIALCARRERNGIL